MARRRRSESGQPRSNERILYPPRESWQQDLVSHGRLELRRDLAQEDDCIGANRIFRVTLKKKSRFYHRFV